MNLIETKTHIYFYFVCNQRTYILNVFKKVTTITILSPLKDWATLQFIGPMRNCATTIDVNFTEKKIKIKNIFRWSSFTSLWDVISKTIAFWAQKTHRRSYKSHEFGLNFFGNKDSSTITVNGDMFLPELFVLVRSNDVLWSQLLQANEGNNIKFLTGTI